MGHQNVDVVHNQSCNQQRPQQTERGINHPTAPSEPRLVLEWRVTSHRNAPAIRPTSCECPAYCSLPVLNSRKVMVMNSTNGPLHSTARPTTVVGAFMQVTTGLLERTECAKGRSDETQQTDKWRELDSVQYSRTPGSVGRDCGPRGSLRRVEHPRTEIARGPGTKYLRDGTSGNGRRYPSRQSRAVAFVTAFG